jgi:Mn2+/Fe2+ NRAMP family transporter
MLEIAIGTVGATVMPHNLYRHSAVVIIGLHGDGSTTELLVLSQVVLAIQLPPAMFPLLHFTSSKRRMGRWRSGWFLLTAGWVSAVLITVMDVWGLPESVKDAWGVVTGAVTAVSHGVTEPRSPNSVYDSADQKEQ